MIVASVTGTDRPGSYDGMRVASVTGADRPGLALIGLAVRMAQG